MSKIEYDFHKLTPVSDVELGIYADALDYVFANNDLKNIAISGPYSAGKSSMLESYKLINPDKKFIHISLTQFETTSDCTTRPGSNDFIKFDDKNIDKKDALKFETDVNALEGKIINQLIHQIDTNKIPQTLFKIKQPLAKEHITCTSLIFTLFWVLLFFLINRNNWSIFVSGIEYQWLKFLLSITTNDLFVIAALMVCIGIVYKGIKKLLKLQHNKNLLRKLNVQGNEIEIFKNDDDSFFDKYLNEILYLFSNAEADTIVFEDMDRYNSNQVFGKLREINQLLNNNPDKEINKTYRFVYLLRDDIFTSKDRTKFFDFIIPVVPIVDSGNSYDKFMEYFGDGDILFDFNSDFLQEISLYIDDIRLLKNIYNEYRIYYNRIQATELSCDKLLGIIVYKNLFPRDFSELQVGKGYVSSLFKNKMYFIDKEKVKIEKNIFECHEKIRKAGEEMLSNIDELDALYFKERNGMYIVDGSLAENYSSRGEYIRKIRESPTRVRVRGTNFTHNMEPSEIEAEFVRMNSIAEYKDRKHILEEKTDKKKKQIYGELHFFENKKSSLENATLSEIIAFDKNMATRVFNSKYIDEIEIQHTYIDVKGNHYFPLIKYLIRNKYIDENYADYMSYFYEKSISRIDRIFLRSVFDVEAKPFNYCLKDPALVVSKVNSRYYSQPEVLNFDLFAYLIEFDDINLPTVINQLRNNHRLDFVLKFWESNREKQGFVQNINHLWPSIWHEILDSVETSLEMRNEYLIDTFYFSPSIDQVKMNHENIITDYISSCAEFLAVSEPILKPITEALELLEVRFQEINYDTSNKELFNAIYRKNLYELNKSMIFMIFKNVFNLLENDEFYQKNYTLIQTKPKESLAIYVNDEIDKYMEFVFSICGERITDNESDAIDILNHPNLAPVHKKKYISVLATKVQDITDIEDYALWPLLLSNKSIPCTIGNILEYFFKFDNIFDEFLNSFINSNDLNKKFSRKDILAEYEEEQAKSFYMNVIQNNNLSDDNYRKFLSGYGMVFHEFSFLNIKDSKFDILTDLKIIKMNSSNLNFVRDNYDSCIMYFILSNINEYAQNTIDESQGNFNIEELKNLLKESVADNNLLRLLEFTQEPISIKDASISDVVKEYIISNNYYNNDLETIISGFDEASVNLKRVIQQMCIVHVADIITNKLIIPYSLLEILLNTSNCSNKDELFASQLDNLTREQAIVCFTYMQMPLMLSALEGKRPTIENNVINTMLLKIMESKKWISSFSEDTRKPGFYRVMGRRMEK